MVKKEDKKKTQNKETSKPFFEAVRKIMLGSIGALSLAQDEMEDFIDKLIERGEIAEQDGRKLVSDLRKKREKKFQERESEINKRLEKIVERIGIPTKTEFQDLTEKISELANKIEELNKMKET